MPATPRRHTTMPRRLAAFAVATALICLIPTSAVALVDGVKETSRSTFVLLPEEGRVHAHATVKLVNQKKPKTSRGPCKNDPRRTCKTRTRYYIKAWGPIQVPADATQLAITGKRVEPLMLGSDRGGTAYAAAIPDLHYRKKQRIDIDYDLVDTGPDSGQRTRITPAYAHFCWNAEHADRGTAQAIVPVGWETVTRGANVKLETTEASTIITLADRKLPGAHDPCTDAFREGAMTRTYAIAPGGQVITLDAWPDDPDWAVAVTDVIETDLPVLEELIGSPMPFPTLTIAEVARINDFGQPSDLDPSVPRLLMDEAIDFPGAPVAALARTWFDERRIADPWLAEGLALWAGLTATGSACPDPGTYPGEGAPTLREWHVGSSDGSIDPMLPAWQAMAACSVVGEVADIIGPERMTSVIDSLLTGTPRYGEVHGRPGSSDPADWRDWLDAVDELGLIPAGETDLELAQRTLGRYAIATPDALAGRFSARSLYHDTLGDLDGASLPAFVDGLMESWAYDAAVGAILEARRVHGVIAAHPTLSDEARATFLGAFEAATSLDALATLEGAVMAWVPPAQPAAPSST